MPDPSSGPPHTRPAHHLPGGKFRIPWPMEEGDRERGFRQLLRWQWERMRSTLPPDPPAAALPRAEPRIARPRAEPDEVRITCVGHATFLLQVGGLNVLTDPVWSRRASPFQWLGPARFTPPGVPFDDLPPIDAVLISHDHYDHLDEPTVRRVASRFGRAVRWIAPLGHGELLRPWGAEEVTELDWGAETVLDAPDGPVAVTCLPAQHWTRRSIGEMNDRLWASFALRTSGGRRVYFAGDSGYWPGYREIGERHGPFDAALIPIGAYEPRWFMRPAHMNPEEAVRTYLDLGGRGVMVPTHWGTFRLTDEDPLEPPVRAAAAWRNAGLPPGDLALLRHGETRVL